MTIVLNNNESKRSRNRKETSYKSLNEFKKRGKNDWIFRKKLFLEGGREQVVVLLVDVQHQGSGVQVHSVLGLSNLQNVKRFFSQFRLEIIEIGLEHTPFVVSVNFFPHLNMQKSCWLWAPTTLKTHYQSVIFSYLTMNNIVKILFLL